jgi:hypothetical protein
MHAAIKVAARAAFAKATSDRPHGPDAGAKQAAADRRKAAATATARANPIAKPTDNTLKPPRKK